MATFITDTQQTSYTKHFLRTLLSDLIWFSEKYYPDAVTSLFNKELVKQAVNFEMKEKHCRE
jgi:hypothetical protein